MPRVTLTVVVQLYGNHPFIATAKNYRGFPTISVRQQGNQKPPNVEL